MHIHYESSLQAKKALSRNGKVMLDNVMVGVVPCIDVVSSVFFADTFRSFLAETFETSYKSVF